MGTKPLKVQFLGGNSLYRNKDRCRELQPLKVQFLGGNSLYRNRDRCIELQLYRYSFLQGQPLQELGLHGIAASTGTVS
jgi:hypothetical protein